MTPRHHDTLAFQRNAGIGEEVFDFRTGDRVMTVDGLPGKVVAFNSGPLPGTEDYEVVLDSGMGGGSYTAAQLKKLNTNTAALHEAVEVTSSIPVEAVTAHTADIDYPELGSILQDRTPIERMAANKDDRATKPQLAQEDPGERMDQEDTPEDEPEDEDNNTDSKAANEPADEAGKDEGDAGPDEDAPPDINEEKVNNTPDVTPPSACSFCGSDGFEEPQMTGRGVRMRCSQCGGTMKSWGGQWEPEFPNSSENKASGNSDWSQGGAAGVANAPGANFKTSSLEAEAGIINWVVDKIYNRIEERKNHQILSPEWASQTGIEGAANIHTNYADYSCQACGQIHPQSLNPNGLTIHGSVSDEYDSEWNFHFTSAWSDVQAKAKRIRKEGGVKILVATNMGVAGEVKGDHNVYESQLNYVPGSKHVADWACGCKWASYTWGRSPAYRRYEGRLCSHALALQYEASARSMFGKEIEADTDRPKWQKAHQPVQVQHQRGTERAPEKEIRRRAVPPGNMKRTFSSLDTDGIYESPALIELGHAPIFAFIQEMARRDEDTISIIEMVASFDTPRASAKQMIFEAFHTDEDGIRRDGDEYETPDGDRFNHGSAEDKDQWDDPEYARANQRDLSDHDGDQADDEHKKRHHNTNDAREHAPHWGWGLPAGVPIETCGQCNGSGCGHCAGQGQIVSDQTNMTSDSPDESDDAGDVSSGVAGIALNAVQHTADYLEGGKIHFNPGHGGPACGAGSRWEASQITTTKGTKRVNCGSCMKSKAYGEAANQKTADYSAADPLAGVDQQTYYAPTNHSNSRNPASTGWATSQDPGDWGRSLITNNFGLTTDSAYHDDDDEKEAPYHDFSDGYGKPVSRDEADDEIDELLPKLTTDSALNAEAIWNQGKHTPDDSEYVGRCMKCKTKYCWPKSDVTTHVKNGEGGAQFGCPKDDGGSVIQTSRMGASDDFHHLYEHQVANMQKKTSALDTDPSVAGVLLRARDTGRLLMIQRALSENDPASGRWEPPGGHLEDGEKPLHGAVREFEEETGHPFPNDAEVMHTWRSGPYRGHLVDVPSESHLDFSRGRQIENPDGDIHEHVAWWEPGHARKNPALRSEMKGAPWDQFKKAAGRHSPPNENDVQYSYERGMAAGYNEPTADPGPLSDTHEYYNPGMKYHFLEGFQDGIQRRHGSLKEASSIGYCWTCGKYKGDLVNAICKECRTNWRPSEPIRTNSTLVNDPDEVGALPYTTGEADGNIFPGQTGGSSGDSSLPHASTDALHGGQGAHTIDSLHQAAWLDSPGAQALMADLGITKSAMKDFSFQEQQDLINEGGGARARNFDDLKIAGTHYEHIKDDDEDLFF